MVKNTSIRIIALLTAVLVLAFTFTGAFADAPLDLHMEVLDVIGESGETFIASGPAVDGGLICASGTVNDLSIVLKASNPRYNVLDVHKRFYCVDGTFDIFMYVLLDNATLETRANWQLGAGTGNYAGLRGGGRLEGTPVSPGVTIFDVYDGRVF